MGVALLLVVAGGAVLQQSVGATPHSGQSVDVAMIGSGDVLNGGELTVVGPAGGLGDFNFTNLDPANVSTGNLASFDTAVLNVASYEMDCDVNALSTPAKADLVSFVSGGGKLIIYDSECSAQDYSWLPFPFTTNNPGAAGATGILTISEENILASASEASSHFIDALGLGTNSDAVGDMNVMTTLDPNWCLSMTGTNNNQVTGPVHAYAFHGSGLIIYNGLDVDDMGSEYSPPYPNGLEKIWLQELQAPLQPSNNDLPCGILVIGTMTPSAPTAAVGTPCIQGIVNSRCPKNPPVSKVTPVPTATAVPPTAVPATQVPPAPAPTRPGGGAAGVISAPDTGSGPGGSGVPTTALLMSAALLLGGLAASTAALRRG